MDEDESFRATRPPIDPDDLVDPPLDFILLDLLGYIGSGAECLSRTNKRIRVTFWVADPPRPSCFTVYSPDLEMKLTGHAPLTNAPKIINTEDDLVLLRIPICSDPPYGSYVSEYFVYQAGTESKRPSLDLLPALPAPPIYISDYQVGLLRCRARDMYFVAVLTLTYNWPGLVEAPDKYNYYYLHLYSSESSETGTWTTRLMTCLDPRPKSRLYDYKYSGKVITMGGKFGSVGWVDHRRGILICDVLVDNRVLRYIPLPSPAVPKTLWLPGTASRDVIVFQGYLKYFEMCVSLDDHGGWEAVEWRRSNYCNEWEKHRVVEVSAEMIKEQPTLKLKPYSGFPVLSLHDVDVVYIMGRDSVDDKEVRVIAVDMRKQTLEVNDVAAGYVIRIPLAFKFYCGSGISKHLRRMSSAS